MNRFIANLLQDESGQDMIEYALVAALIGLSTVAVLGNVSGNISTAYASVGNTLTTAL
jgi:pilus assembly protein Flp/PilA